MEALEHARLNFERKAELAEEFQYLPRRLYNIYTGSLTYDTEDVPYVIVSYICNPTDGHLDTYSFQKHKEDFETLLGKAEQLRDSTGKPLLSVQHQDGFERSLVGVVIPPFPYHKHQQYQREVFRCVAAEAVMQDISHIWMDALCIDQGSLLDLQTQLPVMSEYYSGAACCVVIAEVLRRGLANTWMNRGLDAHMYNLRSNEFRDLSDMQEHYQYRWGLVDEVLCWIIRYHETRVWVFQETLLAKTLVHRAITPDGESIRISTSSFLTDCMPFATGSRPFLAEPTWLEKSLDFISPDLSDDTDQDNLSRWWNFRASKTAKLDFLDKVHQTCYKAQFHRFPYGGSVENGGIRRIDYDSLTEILKRRRCAIPQDMFYGTLGMFPRILRLMMPVRYDISMSTVYAILTYLRVCNGDIKALCVTDRQSWVSTHVIKTDGFPTWLPTSANNLVNFSAQPGPLCKFEVDEYHSLVIEGFWISITNARIACDCSQDGCIGMAVSDAPLLPSLQYQCTASTHDATVCFPHCPEIWFFCHPPLNTGRRNRELRRLNQDVCAGTRRQKLIAVAVASGHVKSIGSIDWEDNESYWLILYQDPTCFYWRKVGYAIFGDGCHEYQKNKSCYGFNHDQYISRLGNRTKFLVV